MDENQFKALFRFGELAMAFIPIQVYTRRFDPAEGLRRGTIFPELYKPYRIQG
ncbi:MAG TPA: spore coat associated protein CotJA [Firmicutes bacterium]|nr:spore coat associated protein CotJA [Bacillota bacterium]